MRPFLFLSLLGSLSCQVQDQPLPTESKVQKLNQADMGSPPPLYQFLYDSAFIPEAQYAEQRTRILVWLRYCDFDEHQLRQLHTLHRRAATLRQRVERTQQEIVQGFELDLIPTYNAIHDMLREGYDLDDPALEQAAQALLETRRHAAREEEILSMRLQSVQALLDEEQEFLRLLTPRQEVYFPDLIFVLRRDLDLAATPGDFHAMVGSLFSAGDPTLLLRGDFSTERKPLNLGGLWSDAAEDELAAPVLHEARKELLLYLLLLEPTIPDAIEAAIAARKARKTPPTR